MAAQSPQRQRTVRSALLLGTFVVLTTACDGLPWSSAPAEPVLQPRITVEGGSLRGKYENGVNTFLGIPYAAPPVRDLRWKPPQPPASWGGVRSAAAFGADCIQHQSPTQQPQSEDCLFLNVWAPVDAEAPLSVMVWIHGGGLTSGSAAVPTYNGSGLARRGVLLVSFNYRLGRFGFFAHPVLTSDDSGSLLGNYGLMDQMAALLWVQRNIEIFGGNPDDITVFGESAGGRSVHALLTSPLSRGLFQKAIIQSGAGLPQMRRIRSQQPEEPTATDDSDSGSTEETTAEAMGVAFATSVGLEDPTASELRGMSGLLVRGPKGDTAPVFPDAMIDGSVLRANFEDAYRQGLRSVVPVVIGANSLEALFGDEPLVGDAALVQSLGSAATEAAALYDGYGTGNDALVAIEMEGDRRQVSGTRRHARLLAASDAPVYLYHFSYVTDARRDRDPAARHGAELGFVFNTFDTAGAPSAADADIAQLIGSYWVQFAKTGDPNHDGSPLWPTSDEDTDELLEFTTLGTATARSNFETDKLDFWDALHASGWLYTPGQQPAGAGASATPASSQTASSSPQ